MKVYDVTRRGVAPAAAIILQGGVALVPTDTVYGLAAHPSAAGAIQRIFELKDRPREKNLPVLLADTVQLRHLGVELNKPAARILESGLVPGPVTLALGFRPGSSRPSWLRGRYEVAIRLPADQLIRAIIRLTGPLLVTSANRSGGHTAEDVSTILQSLSGIPDLVIDGGILSSLPSTLVNCNVSPVSIEREGVVPAARIWEIVNGA